MSVQLTRKRIDLMRSALCHMENHYEGDTPPSDYSEAEWEKELEACFEWLRQVERLRNKKRKQQ